MFESQTPFVLKVHPSILYDPQNDKYSKSLSGLIVMSRRFSGPINIVTDQTTSQLVHQGMSLGCTVRGTIATELAFLRIPVLCSGYPPYMNFLPSRVVPSFHDYQRRLISYKAEPSISDDEYDSVLDFIGLTAAQKDWPSLSPKTSNLACQFSVLMPDEYKVVDRKL